MMNEHSEFVIASRNLMKFVGPRFTEYIETGSVGGLKNYLAHFVVSAGFRTQLVDMPFVLY